MDGVTTYLPKVIHNTHLWQSEYFLPYLYQLLLLWGSRCYDVTIGDVLLLTCYVWQLLLVGLAIGRNWYLVYSRHCRRQHIMWYLCSQNRRYVLKVDVIAIG